MHTHESTGYKTTTLNLPRGPFSILNFLSKSIFLYFFFLVNSAVILTSHALVLPFTTKILKQEENLDDRPTKNYSIDNNADLIFHTKQLISSREHRTFLVGLKPNFVLQLLPTLACFNQTISKFALRSSFCSCHFPYQLRSKGIL